MEAGGSRLENALKVLVFLSDRWHFADMNAVYANYMGPRLPARSTATVAQLPRNALMEIEVIAYR